MVFSDRKVVYNRHATEKQSAETVEASLSIATMRHCDNLYIQFLTSGMNNGGL